MSSYSSQVDLTTTPIPPPPLFPLLSFPPGLRPCSTFIPVHWEMCVAQAGAGCNQELALRKHSHACASRDVCRDVYSLLTHPTPPPPPPPPRPPPPPPPPRHSSITSRVQLQRATFANWPLSCYCWVERRPSCRRLLLVSSCSSQVDLTTTPIPPPPPPPPISAALPLARNFSLFCQASGHAAPVHCKMFVA